MYSVDESFNKPHFMENNVVSRWSTSFLRLPMPSNNLQYQWQWLQHMKAAAALAQASATEGAVEGLPLPRHWGGPPDFPRMKVSEPLAVMTTEAALDEYRQSQRHERVRERMFRRSSNRNKCWELSSTIKIYSTVISDQEARGKMIRFKGKKRGNTGILHELHTQPKT